MYLYPQECGKKTLHRGLDEPTKKKLLKKHNKLRQKVASGKQPGQPGASNMRKLEWDDELVVIAQKWADQCVTGGKNMIEMKIG